MNVDEVAGTDIVVVGAGAAGLVAALRLASAVRRRVTVLTKAAAGTGGATPLAQGGLAAAVGPGDDPQRHAADTVAVGSGLADPAAAAAITGAAPAAVRALARLGVRFDTAADGRPLLGREAGHTRRRVLHAGGDATGAELARALTAAVADASTTRFVQGAAARRILMVDGHVAGVLARHADGRLVAHPAPAVILATGGVGGLYARTTNPPEATGDGLALAARAGARLVDLEFVQFHPTALAWEAEARLPLLSEALRGEGARLVDASGRPVLHGVHPDAELAPRDVVARALWLRIHAGGPTFLDARGVFARAGAFPTVRRLCLDRGLDPATDLLPVTPAAHYHMGGVAVDGDGRTSVPGLWACGEVASTGMHGANRLASNSLLEAVVTGTRVAAAVGAAPRGVPAPPPRLVHTPEPGHDATTTAHIRKIMWDHVGVVRDEAGLVAALDQLDRLADGAGSQDLLLVARLITTAALARRESRGAHWRGDHPAPDPRWQRRLELTMDDLRAEKVA